MRSVTIYEYIIRYKYALLLSVLGDFLSLKLYIKAWLS